MCPNCALATLTVHPSQSTFQQIQLRLDQASKDRRMTKNQRERFASASRFWSENNTCFQAIHRIWESGFDHEVGRFTERWEPPKVANKKSWSETLAALPSHQRQLKAGRGKQPRPHGMAFPGKPRHPSQPLSP